jgi:PAS domain S-box-containing protein
MSSRKLSSLGPASFEGCRGGVTGSGAPEQAEEGLFNAEVAGALQRAILSSANFSSIATDASGIIQIFNVGAERMMGYKATEVTNKITPADISDPQEVIARAKALSLEFGIPIRPGFEALVFKASRGIEDIYELTYIRKDGSRLPAVVSVTALRDGHDAIIGYLLIGTDNTARKLAEIEHQAKFLQRIIDAMPYPVFYEDCERRYIGCNRAFEKFYGITREAIVGKTVYEITPKELADIHSQADAELLSREGAQVYEGWVQSADGMRHNVIFHKATFEGLDGKLAGLVGAVVDITDRKRGEESLRKSEERFRQVVEGSPLGMYIQTDGLFRYLNPSALAMFGAQSAGQLVGQGFLDRIHPDCRAAVSERARSVGNGRRVAPFMDERYLRMDGEAFDTEVTAIPFIFEGRDGAIVFFSDVTERKREEKKSHGLEQQLHQAQKMEAVGRLAGGIAHDFNNLLMVIQSYTEMLQDHLPANDALRKNTREVIRAAQRGASLTGQMLAFSRKQIISPVVLDLNTVIDETAKMLRRIIGEDIELQVHTESLWTIKADPDQISQVLMNLCVNSRDAMPQGGTLTITTGNVTVGDGGIDGQPDISPGDYVKLSVSDTGTGISKDVQEQVFDPFFTTKEVGKGTGLGLAMVYGIVKQSGGFLWVDSKVGEGARFTIYLPRIKGVFVPEVLKREARPRGVETLLVAEDEDALRGAMCEYLRSLGYAVLTAGSGQEALSAAKQQGHIDLLLTDVVMPNMSGRELSQTLGNQHLDLKTIYMSGYTDDAVLRHGIHEMGTRFLQKPFSLGTLAQKVRDTLDRTEPVN